MFLEGDKMNFDKVINRYNTNSAKWDEAAEEYGKDVLYLGVADMDFKSPRPIIEAIENVAKHGIFGYTIHNDKYFSSIQQWMSNRYDWDIEKDWIVFSPRIGIAISLIINSFTKEGDGIIVQSPGYAPLRESVVKNNRKLVTNELKLESGEYKMNLKELEEKMDPSIKMFILCSPHNPTGRVWQEEELKELSEFCIKHNLLVISDEVHSEIVFKGYKHIPFSKINDEIRERSIVCNSITKAFNVPGIMTSNIIIPNKKIREKFKDSLDRVGIHNPNIFSVPVLEEAYGKCEEWLEQLNLYLYDNLIFFSSYLEEHIPRMKLIKPEGTYLAWVDVRDLDLNEDEIEDLFINKAKVGIYIGSIFGESGKGFIRVNLATPRSNLKLALDRIKEVINNIE